MFRKNNKLANLEEQVGQHENVSWPTWERKLANIEEQFGQYQSLVFLTAKTLEFLIYLIDLIDLNKSQTTMTLILEFEIWCLIRN
jgi:hypothetical protein